VKTHHTGGRFAETAKNVRWSTSPQEAGQGRESTVEIQVQTKERNKSEYEEKWQEWQNWTDEQLAKKTDKG